MSSTAAAELLGISNISDYDETVKRAIPVFGGTKEVRIYLKSNLSEFAGNSVYFTHDGQAIEAYLTKNGINHSVTGGASPEAAAIYERLNDLILNAEYSYSSLNDEHSNINKKIQGKIEWNCFVGVVSVGGLDYPVVFKLRTLDVDLRSQIYSIAEKKRNRCLPRRRTTGEPDGRTAELRSFTDLWKQSNTAQSRSQEV